LSAPRPYSKVDPTPCRLSTTACSIYSQLDSISGGRLHHPQPEDAPCRGDRDPHTYTHIHLFEVWPTTNPTFSIVVINFKSGTCNQKEQVKFSLRSSSTPWITLIQKFRDWIDKEIYAYLWHYSSRSNTKGYGGKTH
jgi:hypothetical protein